MNLVLRWDSSIRIPWCNSLPKTYKKSVQTWTCAKRYKNWWTNHLKKKFVLFQVLGLINLINMLRILENYSKPLEISLKSKSNFKKKPLKMVVNSLTMILLINRIKNSNPFMSIQCLKSLVQSVILILFICHPIIRIKCIKSLTQIFTLSKKETWKVCNTTSMTGHKWH